MTDTPDTTSTVDASDRQPLDSIQSLRNEVASQQQRISQLESKHISTDGSAPAAQESVARPSAQAPRTAAEPSAGASREHAAVRARISGSRNDVLTYMRLRRAAGTR